MADDERNRRLARLVDEAERVDVVVVRDEKDVLPRLTRAENTRLHLLDLGDVPRVEVGTGFA
ncbi:MAG: hypothetical protein SV760_00015 [Halobacteria archaeon]|nr:hypothetical protein [Halobacteria archaeon]